jgi:hypothetical protein
MEACRSFEDCFRRLRGGCKGWPGRSCGKALSMNYWIRYELPHMDGISYSMRPVAQPRFTNLLACGVLRPYWSDCVEMQCLFSWKGFIGPRSTSAAITQLSL